MAASAMMVMQVRAVASIPGAPTSVVYLTLHNAGGTSDRLLSASTPVAQRVEIHAGGVSHGVAMMRPIAGIDIAVGSMVEFKSGGNHLMLIGLRQPLSAGSTLSEVRQAEGPCSSGGPGDTSAVSACQ
jgi:copper(I)-binding protein